MDHVEYLDKLALDNTTIWKSNTEAELMTPPVYENVFGYNWLVSRDTWPFSWFWDDSTEPFTCTEICYLYALQYKDRRK